MWPLLWERLDVVSLSPPMCLWPLFVKRVCSWHLVRPRWCDCCQIISTALKHFHVSITYIAHLSTCFTLTVNFAAWTPPLERFFLGAAIELDFIMTIVVGEEVHRQERNFGICHGSSANVDAEAHKMSLSKILRTQAYLFSNHSRADKYR